MEPFMSPLRNHSGIVQEPLLPSRARADQGSGSMDQRSMDQKSYRDFQDQVQSVERPRRIGFRSYAT